MNDESNNYNDEIRPWEMDYMRKKEKEEDELYEKNQNHKLEGLIKEWEGIVSSDNSDNSLEEQKNILEKIIGIYVALQHEYLDYNKDDYNFFKKELEKVIELKKYKDVEKAHKEQSDPTWRQFEEDERRKDLYDKDKDEGFER